MLKRAVQSARVLAGAGKCRGCRVALQLIGNRTSWNPSIASGNGGREVKIYSWGTIGVEVAAKQSKQ